MQQDPHESHNRVAHYAKRQDDEVFFAALNSVLADAPLPTNGLSETDPAALPIIYIVGAPRSGTTLLSQLCSRHLPVGYVDNIMARFWRRPLVGIRLSRTLLGDVGRAAISLTSRHGVTQDIGGPHEFGYFWRHWLALDEAPTHKLSARALAGLDANGLRQTLREQILGEFAAPVVFKNVICGLQAEYLSRVHPSSLFVWIRRDIQEVLRSILKCRHERYGNYAAWWSLKPSNFSQLLTIDNPAQQVLEQIRSCEAEFAAELSKPGVHTLPVDYAQLLADPGAVLRRICDTVRSNFDFPIALRADPLPALSAALPTRLPARLEADVAAALRDSA